MQSILQNKTYLPFPTVTEATGPLTRTRQSRLLMIYALIYTLGALLVFALPHSGLSTFGHSLMLPGSGLHFLTRSIRLSLVRHRQCYLAAIYVGCPRRCFLLLARHTR